MTDKIQTAFSEIRAEAELKQKTKEYIKQHPSNKTGRSVTRARMMSWGLAIITMLMIGGGFAAYFTPVAAISIDAETSIELQLNRFNRVVDFEQYGQGEPPMAHMMHSHYTEAVESILVNPVMSSNEEDGAIEITVAGKDTAKVEQMIAALETQTDPQGHHLKMFTASSEEQQSAHQQGMSLGKHRMYQLLSKQNPKIQPQEMVDYSMHDLHQMMKDTPNMMPQPDHQPKHQMNHH